MIRRRSTNAGLPWRVYERYGKRVWRIWYQPLGDKRVTLFECMASDVTKGEARRKAKLRYQQLYAGSPEAHADDNLTFKRLGELYFDWQGSLPVNDDGKKAETTIAENLREFATLCGMFGSHPVDEIEAPDWFRYQDTRRKANAGPKANKELALASAIMEYGRLRGLLQVNTARIPRVPTRPLTRKVELAEIDAALSVARTMGPGATLQVLCARAAMLCIRRPTEIQSLRVAQVKDDGIEFVSGKRKSGSAERTAMIEFSPALRGTIDEALAIPRRVDICPYVFGTQDGTIYTKSGWGSNWRRIMAKCRKMIPGFQPFTLRDCRPAGITDKKARGDMDTLDGTMHADSRMVEQIYDRRRRRKSKPAA